ncbi:MAG: hypothetical protein RL156_100 [Bacteroidota bacterium]|jgi:hypothetical protein
MSNPYSYPYPKELAVTGIVRAIILSIITCGIYGLIWQNRRFEIYNAWLGRYQFSFWKWLGIGLVTCGIYFIYTEYIVARSLNEVQRRNGFEVETNYPLLFVILSITGLSIVAHCIEQSEINSWYERYPAPEQYSAQQAPQV